jgi:hypothetical protein
MKTEIEFHDPFFTSTLSGHNGLKISYPLADERSVKDVVRQLRLNAQKYFSSHSLEDIQKISDKVDSSFKDLSEPENVELIHKKQRLA